MPFSTRDHRSLERMLLAAAARALLDGAPPREAKALLARTLDWDWLLRKVEADRLGALLHAVLPPQSIPGPVRDRLRAAWVHGRRQYLLGIAQFGQILSVFERAGVAVIPLRGPALAETLYRDPTLRPFTDLDLLIRETDISRAVPLLSALGFRSMEAGLPLSHKLTWRHAASFATGERDALPIDLHWGLVDFPGFAPVPPVAHQELWDRALRVEAPGGVRWELCPEDLLVYLALHWAVHHALCGLIWPLDLALLILQRGESLDWEAVSERAIRWRVRGPLFFALREVQGQFNVAVPPRVLTRLRPGGVRPALLCWLCRRGEERLERLDYLVPLLLMDRGSDLLRALARASVPPASWVRHRYGKASVLGAYLAHFARVRWVCSRTARGSLWPDR